jgi:ectoine hydroxylase-related dioxygenase (phytanoyl-CoA dioxygenase family)
MALDRIHPDSGPFEWIPGSHVWPLLRGDKVQSFLTDEERSRRDGPLKAYHWPAYAERFVTPAVEAEIAARGVAPVQFLAERGDVLIWHGRLMHRGSRAKVPAMQRRSLIAHYSGVNHRPDMPARATDENGMVYAVFDHPLR